MDRGVIVGGALIAASFLGAVLLNRSAHEEAAPAVTASPPPTQGCDTTRPPNEQAPPQQDAVEPACDSTPAKTLPADALVGTGPIGESPESSLPSK